MRLSPHFRATKRYTQVAQECTATPPRQIVHKGRKRPIYAADIFIQSFFDSYLEYAEFVLHRLRLPEYSLHNHKLHPKGTSVKTTEKIWHEYHIKLATFIGSKVTEDVVDDILQDVFMKIHTRIGSLKDNAKLESWLYQITRNTVVDYYRSRRPTEDLPDWIVQPQSEEGETVRKELSSCLEPMVNELPDKYREAVQLSDLENRTQKDIAELENISLSGAKSRVQRGRALLKTMLQDCCQIEINQNKQLVSYERKGKE